jgi:hypothetical protein
MTQTAELHLTQDEQSLRYLASASVGRVVVSNPDEVLVIPVSFVAERECMVFQISATYRKAIAECDRLVFHADGIDSTTSIGWSVTVRGAFSVMSGYGSLAPPAGFISSTPIWQQQEEASLWIRLRTDTLDMRESVRFAG